MRDRECDRKRESEKLRENWASLWGFGTVGLMCILSLSKPVLPVCVSSRTHLLITSNDC